MKILLAVLVLVAPIVSFSQTSGQQAQIEEVNAIIDAQDFSDADFDVVKAYFNRPDFKLIFDDMLSNGVEEAVLASKILSLSYQDAIALQGKREVDTFIYGFTAIIERDKRFANLNTQLDTSLMAIDSDADVVYPFSLEHVSLFVKDVGASAAFYGKTFGLSEIFNRGEVEGIRWFSLGKDRELHLISTIKSTVFTNKAAHFAVTALDFDGFITRLQQAKIPYQDWAGTLNTISLRPDGVRQIYIQDPDGNWIEINSPRR